MGGERGERGIVVRLRKGRRCTINCTMVSAPIGDGIAPTDVHCADAEALKAKREARAQRLASEEQKRLLQEKEAAVCVGISTAELRKVQKIEVTSELC